MKSLRQTLVICLSIVFTLEAAFCIPANAQSSESKTSQDQSTVSDRIRRVENGLLPPFQIKGESTAKMNIADRMKHYKVPGISVAVINNGKIEWQRSYGVKEAGKNEPVSVDTMFQAASISKPVAAMAALKMVQDGKFSLDEDVNKKLVSWKMPENEFTKEKKVTLRGLLSHGAGLTVSGFPGYASNKPLPTVVQILDGSAPANTKPVRVQEAPGTRWSYSGGGLTGTQLLMTDVSGRLFPKLMQDAVLKKLDMKNSTYEQPLPAQFHSQAAVAHNSKGEKIAGNWHVYPEMAAAGLWTTPSDLARFAIELQQARAGKSKKVISPEMARQMLTKQTGAWGLGITLSGEGASARFSHGGSNEGYRCSLVAYNETGQGAVVMTNSDNGDQLINEIMRAVAVEYGWIDYLAKEKTIVNLESRIFESLIGQYQFVAGGNFTVLKEDGNLRIQLGGEKKYELLPESETKYFLREMPLEVVFVKDANGNVTEMINYYSGQEYRLKKIK